MRIEINSGGISGLIAISVFELDMKKTSDELDDMISSFQAVKKAANNLNGGVEGLGATLDHLQARINEEEDKKESLNKIWAKANEFLSDAIKIDKQVAEAIKDSKEEFYRVNPWSKPTADRDGWDWFVHAVSDVFNDIADTFEDAWDSIVEWYEYGGGKEILHIVCKVVTIGLEIANFVLDIVLLVPPLTAIGIAKIVLDSAALLVTLADGGLDIFNEGSAFAKKQQALEAEKRGDYTEAARLRKEAGELSDQDSWRDKWWNDGEFNGWDVLGAVMGGVEIADAIVGLDGEKIGKGIEALDDLGDSIKSVKNLGDLGRVFKNLKNIHDGFSDIKGIVDDSLDLAKGFGESMGIENMSANISIALGAINPLAGIYSAFHFAVSDFIDSSETLSEISEVYDGITGTYDGIKDIFEKVS